MVKLKPGSSLVLAYGVDHSTKPYTLNPKRNMVDEAGVYFAAEA